MRLIFLPPFLLCFAASAVCVGQTTPTQNGIVPVEEIQRWHNQLKDKRLQFPAASASVALYKIQYPSTDFDGKPVTLSGLLELPQGAPIKGLLIYFHGTTADPAASPSRYTGANNAEAQLAAFIFASGGYAVAMPDYIGLGDDTAHVHPYPLSEANSHSGIDMVLPAAQVATKLGLSIPPKLFVSGYSEGGGVAMWMVRHVEAQPISGFTLTASAPMSGPYDLSGVTAKSLLGISKDIEGTAIKLFLMGFTAESAYVNLHQDLKLYLDPKMAAYVPMVFSQHLSDDETAKKLTIEGVKLEAIDSIRRLLTPMFKKALATQNSDNPLIAELRKNDCYDWAPQTPMLLPYLTTDQIVDPENTLEAIMCMRARGVGSYLVDRLPIEDARLDHITTVPFAMVAGRLFFDSKLTDKP